MIHYDPHRWRDHFFDIHGTLVREIGGRVAVAVACAAVVTLLHEYKIAAVAIPSFLHTLVGSALGLLLVFRTNSSYDRFWEGRKLWGGIVNETRNLVRASSVVLRDDRETVLRIARWTALFPWAATGVLRGTRGLGPHTSGLPEDEVAQAENAQHQGLAVAARITQCLDNARRKGAISDIVFTSLDANVQQLIDYLGGCERIRRTPLPFAYVVHLRRALVLFCGTLPFALVKDYGWGTILDVLVVSYIFFGIEEIGVEIEGPFGSDENDLPLEEISETIHRNLYALAAVDRQEREALEEGL